MTLLYSGFFTGFRLFKSDRNIDPRVNMLYEKMSIIIQTTQQKISFFLSKNKNKTRDGCYVKCLTLKLEWGECIGPKIDTTNYQAKLETPDKGCTIEELAVCISYGPQLL